MAALQRNTTSHVHVLLRAAPASMHPPPAAANSDFYWRPRKLNWHVHMCAVRASSCSFANAKSQILQYCCSAMTTVHLAWLPSVLHLFWVLFFLASRVILAKPRLLISKHAATVSCDFKIFKNSHTKITEDTRKVVSTWFQFLSPRLSASNLFWLILYLIILLN